MLQASKQRISSRSEQWEWLGTIADSLQFESIKILLNNAPKESKLERSIAHLDLSYYEILSCYHDVKQGYAEQRFLFSDKAETSKPNETFEDMKNNLLLTIKSVDNIIEIVSSELENLNG